MLPENHPRLTKRPFTMGEVVADGVVHTLALVAGLIAFSLLLGHAMTRANLGVSVALSVYALGYFTMFGFSLAYNMVPPSPLKWLLRRFDHSAIFVMIAGTYTAFLVQFDDRALALTLGVIVWVGAALGVAVKVVFPGRFEKLSLVAYLALGFVGLIGIDPATRALPPASLWLLVAGGATYVGGIAFYKWHRLRFHNALWHLCVAIAAGLHFAGVAIAVHG